MRRFWTNEEKEYVKNNWKCPGDDKYIGYKLDRTWSSVRKIRQLMGLKYKRNTNVIDFNGDDVLVTTKYDDEIILSRDDYYEYVHPKTLHVSDNGYVMINKHTRLHRIIMECDNSQYVDHIDLNKLNNIRDNLRLCNKITNGVNRKNPKNNTSGCKGVVFCKQTNKWRVTFKTVHNIKIDLGRYINIKDAVISRLRGDLLYNNTFCCDSWINDMCELYGISSSDLCQRILVIADVHGSYRGFKQVLEKSKFDYKNDVLISLGDLFDGYPESFEIIEELMKIKYLVSISGNHDKSDDFTINYFKTGYSQSIHFNQGGSETVKSYEKNGGVPQSHIDFVENMIPYFEIKKNNKFQLFVHGGYDWTEPIENQEEFNLMWDRELFFRALNNQKIAEKSDLIPKQLGIYDEIYIGHTTTSQYTEDCLPMHNCNVWCIDTGGGWEGKVTIMDVDTKEFWQSDYCYELYPECKGRR